MDAIEQMEREILEELDTAAEVFVEPHIVVGRDRVISLPACFKNPNCFAVQFDHNIETVTFDCPRYWDEHDLTTLAIFVVYQRADGHKEPCLCKNVRVNENDENLIHFDWTISQNVTGAAGKLSFILCAKKTDEDGLLKNCWHSLLNEEATIAPSIEGEEHTVELEPDILTDMLLRLQSIEDSIKKLEENPPAVDSGIDFEVEGSFTLGEVTVSDDGEGNVTMSIPDAVINTDDNGNVTIVAPGLTVSNDGNGNLSITS